MEETNLEKAARLYPIGTTFISAATGAKRTVINNKWKLRKYNGDIYTEVEGQMHGYVYSNGKWAEIVSYAEPEVINNYQIY